MDNFIKQIAVTLALTQRDVEEAVNYSLDEALNALNENDSVEVSGFGTFHIRKKAIPLKIAAYERGLEELKKKPFSENLEMKKRVIENNLEMLRKRYEH